MAIADNYYYNMLTGGEKQVYVLMKKGLDSLQAEFSVPFCDGATLMKVFSFVRLDNPSIIASDRFSYKYFPNASAVTIVPSYMFTPDKIRMHTRAMASRVNKLCAPIMNKSEAEKEKFVHDFICSNVNYDKLKKQYSHEIIGPLGNGVGVCEGIAKSVKVLCDKLGLWCIVVLCHNNPEKNIKYRHAWNIIKINGKYYHFDATFDNSLSDDSEIRYDYFNLSDTQIFRDHQPLIYRAVECADGGHTYYRDIKMAFSKYEQVASRVAQYAKKKKPLTFAWVGSYLTKDVLNELVGIISDESKGKGRHRVISLNWPQAVLKISFTDDEKAEADIRLEDANEGEKYTDSQQSEWII